MSFISPVSSQGGVAAGYSYGKVGSVSGPNTTDASVAAQSTVSQPSSQPSTIVSLGQSAASAASSNGSAQTYNAAGLLNSHAQGAAVQGQRISSGASAYAAGSAQQVGNEGVVTQDLTTETASQTNSNNNSSSNSNSSNDSSTRSTAGQAGNTVQDYALTSSSNAASNTAAAGTGAKTGVASRVQGLSPYAATLNNSLSGFAANGTQGGTVNTVA
jgi:hypothetical protein